MFSISNDELSKSVRTVHTGDQIRNCKYCGEDHILTGGIDLKSDQPTESILTYSCKGKTYLAAIDNKLLP